MATPDQIPLSVGNDDESDYASGHTPSEFNSSEPDSGNGEDNAIDYSGDIPEHEIPEDERQGGDTESDSYASGYTPSEFQESEEESDYVRGYTPSEFASENEENPNSQTSPPLRPDDEEKDAEPAFDDADVTALSRAGVLTAPSTSPPDTTAKGRTKRSLSSSPPASSDLSSSSSPKRTRKKARTQSPSRDEGDEHLFNAPPEDEEHGEDADDEGKDSDGYAQYEEGNEEENEQVWTTVNTSPSHQLYAQNENVEGEHHGIDARFHANVSAPQGESKDPTTDMIEKTLEAVILQREEEETSRTPSDPEPTLTDPSRDVVDIPGNVSTQMSSYQQELLTIPDFIAAKFSLNSACEEAESLFTPKKPYKSTVRNFGLLRKMCSRPEIILCLVSWLDVDTLLELYAIDKHFHWLMNSHYTTFMKACLRLNAPFAVDVFPWRWYGNLTIPDPASRLLDQYQSQQLAQGLTVAQAQNTATINQFRRVPSFCYAKFVVHRHNVVHDIIHELRRRGLKVPEGTFEAVLKCWFTMDIAQNGTRIGLIHHRPYWRDEDLWNAQHFFMKWEMACADPLETRSAPVMSTLFLGLRHLTDLRNVLQGKLKWYDVLQRKVWYDYQPSTQYPNDPIFGIQPAMIGRGCLEGWGALTNVRLMRVDQLVINEMRRRGLSDINEKCLHLMMYGFWPDLEWLEGNWQRISRRRGVKWILEELLKEQVEERKHLAKQIYARKLRKYYRRPLIEGMD